MQSELHKAVVAVVHNEILLQTHEHSPEPPLQLRPVLRVAHRLEAAARLREVQALQQVLGGEDEELASQALVGLAVGVPGLAMAFVQLGVFGGPSVPSARGQGEEGKKGEGGREGTYTYSCSIFFMLFKSIH